MFENEMTYTAEQVATAAQELRDAAGSDAAPETDDREVVPDGLSTRDAVVLLKDEVRLLRERGFGDEHIADLITGFDIEVTAEDLEK